MPRANSDDDSDSSKSSSSSSYSDSSNDDKNTSSDEEEEEEEVPPTKVYESFQEALDNSDALHETETYGCGTALIKNAKAGSVTRLVFFRNNVTKDRIKLVCSWCSSKLQISSWDCHYKKCAEKQMQIRMQQKMEKMEEEKRKKKAKKKRKKEQDMEAKKKVSAKTLSTLLFVTKPPRVN